MARTRAVLHQGQRAKTVPFSAAEETARDAEDAAYVPPKSVPNELDVVKAALKTAGLIDDEALDTERDKL